MARSDSQDQGDTRGDTSGAAAGAAVETTPVVSWADQMDQEEAGSAARGAPGVAVAQTAGAESAAMGASRASTGETGSASTRAGQSGDTIIAGAGPPPGLRTAGSTPQGAGGPVSKGKGPLVDDKGRAGGGSSPPPREHLLLHNDGSRATLGLSVGISGSVSGSMSFGFPTVVLDQSTSEDRIISALSGSLAAYGGHVLSQPDKLTRARSYVTAQGVHRTIWRVHIKHTRVGGSTDLGAMQWATLQDIEQLDATGRLASPLDAVLRQTLSQTLSVLFAMDLARITEGYTQRQSLMQSDVDTLRSALDTQSDVIQGTAEALLSTDNKVDSVRDQVKQHETKLDGQVSSLADYAVKMEDHSVKLEQLELRLVALRQLQTDPILPQPDPSLIDPLAATDPPATDPPVNGGGAGLDSDSSFQLLPPSTARTSASSSRRKAVESSVKPTLPSNWNGFPEVDGIISCDFDDVVDGAYSFLVQADAYRAQLYACYEATTDQFVIMQISRCFLEGSESRTWWKSSEKKCLSKIKEFTRFLTDYDMFKRAFVSHYFPADYVKEARSRVRRLTMSACQDNLMSYLVNFTTRRHTLEFLTDKDYSNMYVEWLFDGLSHDVRQHITSRGFHEKTAKFDELFDCLESYATERPSIVRDKQKETGKLFRAAEFRAARRRPSPRAKFNHLAAAHQCARCTALNGKVVDGDEQQLGCHACGAQWKAAVPGQQQCPKCGHSFFLGATGAERQRRAPTGKVAKLRALLTDELLDLLQSDDDHPESSGDEKGDDHGSGSSASDADQD